MYGLDIGGTKIELAIFDADFCCVKRWRQPTPKGDYKKFLQCITDMVVAADKISGGADSVGIGLPGQVGSASGVVSANIPCINGRFPEKDLTKALNRPVAVDNDARTFLLSEITGGAAKEVDSALGLVLGTGIAVSLAIDGILYSGRNNIAGEFGHNSLPATMQQKYSLPLLPCGCGSVGCVEKYLSSSGLDWFGRYFGAIHKDVPGLMEQVRQQHKKGLRAFEAYTDCLAHVMAELTLMFDPDTIVLGGGLSNINEIYDKVPAAMSDYLLPNLTVPKIVAPKFGDSSGVRGAALIGKQLITDAT